MNRASSATGWVRNPDGTLGWTWNPITGCLNGCEYCYARKLANGRLKARYLANPNIVGNSGAVSAHTPDELMVRMHDPFYPRFWEDRYLDFTTKRIRHHHRGRRGIFICDMSDLFGIGIPEKWTEKVLEATAYFPKDRFYLLTKQPQNLIKFSPFPDNCKVGVTATDYDMFVDACGYLGALKHEGKAKTAFVSIEPLLSWDSTDSGNFILNWLMMGEIDQVIIGAQTKPYKPPNIEWVQEIVQACDKAGIPVFLKDNLKPLIQEAGMGKAKWAAREWVQCKYPILRQEIAEVIGILSRLYDMVDKRSKGQVW